LIGESGSLSRGETGKPSAAGKNFQSLFVAHHRAGLTFAAADTCVMGMLLARMSWNQKPKEMSQRCAPNQA
jgi:hypothetical protein